MEATSNDKIAEALKLLEEAAKEKKDELRNLVSDKYTHLKTVLVSAEQSAAESLCAAQKREIDALIHARDVSAAKVKEAATAVCDHVQTNPWPYIGGTAVIALLAGYVMGHKK